MLSKDVKTIKNSVSEQNFNSSSETIIPNIKKVNEIEINNEEILNNTFNKIDDTKTPKEQLDEWFNSIDNKNKIRKQDIPDIHFNNTSLILLLCKARNYYNLDNADKMSYEQFKDYLYTISEIKDELI